MDNLKLSNSFWKKVHAWKKKMKIGKHPFIWLQRVANLKFFQCCQILSGLRLNMEEKDQNGRTPFHLALEWAQLEIVQFLQNKG